MGGKVKYYSLDNKERNKYLNKFYDAVYGLKSKEEIINFFKDLLSPSEAIMFGRRLEIAERLLSGEDYETIKNEMKVGVATIIQVNKWLNDGFGGYRKVLKNFKDNKKDYEWEIIPKYDGPDTLTSLRRRYPAHFLLLNLLLAKKVKKKK